MEIKNSNIEDEVTSILSIEGFYKDKVTVKLKLT